MFFKKKFEVKLEILDPILIYAKDIEDSIMINLKKKYLKKCFQSIYIMEIIKINKKSLIKMSSDLDGSAYVYVVFEAVCFKIEKGLILNNIKFENNKITGTVKYNDKKKNVEFNVRILSDKTELLLKEMENPEIILIFAIYRVNSYGIKIRGMVRDVNIPIDLMINR